MFADHGKRPSCLRAKQLPPRERLAWCAWWPVPAEQGNTPLAGLTAACARRVTVLLMAARDQVGDLTFRALFGTCGLLARPVGLVLEWWLRHHQPALLQWLAQRPAGLRLTLRRIAFTRLARSALKVLLLSGAEAAVLRRVRCRGLQRLPHGGCVLALVHSPWGRPLARWALAERFAFVFAHRRWARWAGVRHLSPTPAGLRQAMAHLGRGERVVVVVDEFVARGGCEVELCGRVACVSLRAARIAAAAAVPLVPVRVCYGRWEIQLKIGVPVFPGHGWAGYACTTRRLMREMARWTARRPEEWNDLFEFFEKAEFAVSNTRIRARVTADRPGRGRSRKHPAASAASSVARSPRKRPLPGSG